MPQVPLSNIPIRPLNKGMFLNLPPNGIPTGGFLRTQNMRITEAGLQRRDGFINYDENNSGDIKSSLLDIIHFYRRNANSETLYLTEKALLSKSGTSLTNKNFTFETLLITDNTAGSEIEVTATTDDDMFTLLRQGDTLITNMGDFEIESYTYAYAAPTYTWTIKIFSPAPQLASSLTGTKVEHNLVSEGNMTPSYALLPVEATSGEDTIVLADQADRGLYKYDAVGTFSKFEIDSSVGGAPESSSTNVTSARTVCYFDGRLWVGNTIEIDGVHRQRIRWSDVNTFDRFRYERYVDLPYTEGQLIKLLPMGSLLVAYFEDAVYLGRFTNRPDLPYFFTRLETGLVGPLSDRSVTKWVDNHYFVGQDDIYMLSEATGIQPIGAPIISESLEWSKTLNRDLQNHIKVVHDLETDSIAFLIPDYSEAGSEITGGAERLWRYFYKTQTWSYDEVFFLDNDKENPAYLFMGLCSSKFYAYGRSWEDWVAISAEGPDGTGATDTAHGTDNDLAKWIKEAGLPVLEDNAFSDFPTWYSLIDETIKPRTMKLAVQNLVDDKLMILQEDKAESQDLLGLVEYPIWVVIESPDLDLGTPDLTKTFNRLSVKSFKNRIDRYTGGKEPDQIGFDVRISTDNGYSFKRPTPLRWRRSFNEGKADFRATGAAIRFKLISSDAVPSYKLSEIVIRTVSRGLQVQN